MVSPVFPSLVSFSLLNEQLSDNDSPYVFGLPDNIERSLQRTTSTAVIRQLRALSAVDAEASKYDREKWRAQVTINRSLTVPILTVLLILQLGPILELWQVLTSSTPGILGKKHAIESTRSSGANSASSGAPNAQGKPAKQVDPVDDFVTMQNELAGELCSAVDAALNALKKVRLFRFQRYPIFHPWGVSFIGSLRNWTFDSCYSTSRHFFVVRCSSRRMDSALGCWTR